MSVSGNLHVVLRSFIYTRSCKSMNRPLCYDAQQQQTEGVPMAPRPNKPSLRTATGRGIAMEYVAVPEVSILPGIDPDTAAPTLPKLPKLPKLPPVRAIRVGAFTIDGQSSTILWRGEPLPLSTRQRDTLRVLLQHAGQILSRERLSAMLHVSADLVDDYMRSLRAALETAGVNMLPRRAEGCGYILWR
jgi:biotin operon repressor